MKILACTLLLFSTRLFAIDCNAVVQDDANVLSNSDQQQIQVAASQVINQGFDVRVVAAPLGSYSNLDQLEKSWESNCSSWQAADGGRKNTLLVLAVAPRERKLGMYFGGALRPALSEHWNRIKSGYMAPRFRDKDWKGGFVATLEQINRRVTVSQNEAKSGGPTTINQATDYSGLWTVMKWILAIIVLSGGVSLLLVLFFTRKKKREEQQAAQQEAALARNKAATYLNKARNTLVERQAAGEAVAKISTALDSVQEELVQLNGSLSTDPNQNGLSVEEYNRIRDQYDSVYNNARQAMEPSQTTTPPMPEGVKVLGRMGVKKKKRDRGEVNEAYTRPVPPSPSYTAPVSSSNTNIVVVNNEEYRERRDDEERERSRSSYEPSSSYSNSSSDDSGGSSDFGSSSSSDSGGSSDFGSSDSSSSGGSSDF